MSSPAAASKSEPSSCLPPPPQGPLPVDVGTLSPTSTSAGAFARSLATSFAFIFKRPPLRFFRPVKISTYGALQAMAEERGKSVSWSFVRSVIKKEGLHRFLVNHVIPPFLFNTAIGLTLFGTYTFTERATEGWIENDYYARAIAGATAGAAQSVISAPLDNLRLGLTISHQAGKDKTRVFAGWWPLIRSTLFAAANAKTTDVTGRPVTRMGQLKDWAAKGWAMGGLSVLKDSMGFAVFFTIFQIGRDVGKWLADQVDRSLDTLEVKRRTWTGRIFQSAIIVLSGATAGWAYGVVGEPIEILRRTIWKSRLEWRKLQEAQRPPSTSLPTDTRQSPSPKLSKLSSTFSTCGQFRNRLKLKREKLEEKLLRFHASRNPLYSPTLPTAFSILRWNLREHGILKLIRSSGFKPQPPPSVAPGGALGSKRVSGVTGFKSFLLNPYAIGFFVWAVCSGDLV